MVPVALAFVGHKTYAATLVAYGQAPGGRANGTSTVEEPTFFLHFTRKREFCGHRQFGYPDIVHPFDTPLHPRRHPLLCQPPPPPSLTRPGPGPTWLTTEAEVPTSPTTDEPPAAPPGETPQGSEPPGDPPAPANDEPASETPDPASPLYIAPATTQTAGE